MGSGTSIIEPPETGTRPRMGQCGQTVEFDGWVREYQGRMDHQGQDRMGRGIALAVDIHDFRNNDREAPNTLLCTESNSRQCELICNAGQIYAAIRGDKSFRRRLDITFLTLWFSVRGKSSSMRSGAKSALAPLQSKTAVQQPEERSCLTERDPNRQ